MINSTDEVFNLKLTTTKISDLLFEAIKNIEDVDDLDNRVPSGFRELDDLIGGWKNSSLTIIAARPGMGKTAFALSLIRNVAIEYKKPVAVFSLEMEAVEMVNRLITMETGLDSDKLRRGKLTQQDWNQLHTNTDYLSEAPIYFNDTPGLSINEFRTIAHRLKQQNDISLILIDYLQLLRGIDNKVVTKTEVPIISRTLKEIAKELNIPIIVTSQLSSNVEETEDKRPLLSHLREMGPIEQDADLVCMLYRPEYYGFRKNAAGESTDGMAELIVARNKHGNIRDIHLKFDADLIRFYNLGK